MQMKIPTVRGILFFGQESDLFRKVAAILQQDGVCNFTTICKDVMEFRADYNACLKTLWQIDAIVIADKFFGCDPETRRTGNVWMGKFLESFKKTNFSGPIIACSLDQEANQSLLQNGATYAVESPFTNQWVREETAEGIALEITGILETNQPMISDEEARQLWHFLAPSLAEQPRKDEAMIDFFERIGK